jgi:protein-L-isoaspartate(D-aspartate) O-methyltransferase
MPTAEERRQHMVDRQLAARGIAAAPVLAAMGRVPREAFVAPQDAGSAYDDRPLPIGHGQTISQPYIVALMLEAAALAPGDRVLEIGTGSGYAAAVLAEIAAEVHTIERHAPLARAARDRLARAGYDAVRVHVGDGTLGWAEAAPYDAILVAAGGPDVPEALKAQLAPGGRLIIPVGDVQAAEGQSLMKITRTAADSWARERISAVRFVPLIGAQGWAEDCSRPAPALASAAPADLPAHIAAAADPLPAFDDPAFGRLFERWAGCRVVLLGEASHGTAEFYRARAAITRHLVAHHGFQIVAVEADWPDAAAVNRHVTHQPPRADGAPAFTRFPTWMWRNTEVADFIAWLRGHNDGRPTGRRAGFYGLDIYNMRASIAAVLDYLDSHDPGAAAIARERYGCLTPWQSDPATYGRAVISRGFEDCEDAVVAQLRDLLDRRLGEAPGDGFLDAAQNARLVRAAERYYRVMYHGGPAGWNLRDTHMFETLEHLLDARGPGAKAVVWAHNSHIGDARATEMGAARGQLNLGQLCRQRFGDAAALIGMGTHAGTVAAASDWGGEMQAMRVRPSREDSYEALCHDAGQPRFLLDLARDAALRDRLEEDRLQRFIGVIYRPATELQSHYALSVLPRQYDGWLWFDDSLAVTPLGPQHARAGAPDTWPFGL